MNEYQKNILTKRFQTTMIGSLFEFEKAFGYLWGHNKDEDSLSERELDFLELWDSVRNQILNNGNNQLRKAIADLGHGQNIKYSYKFNKYHRKDDYEN